MVIVFTQYDRLVRAMRLELKDDYPNMDDHILDNRCVEEAWKAFEKCLQSLRKALRRLNIQMPPYAKVSGTFVPFALPGCFKLACSSSGSSGGHFETYGSDWENYQGAIPRRCLDYVGNNPTGKPPTQN